MSFDLVLSFFPFLFVCAVAFGGWWWADAQLHRAENKALRREIARLSKHPSTYEPEPLPYMRRYADDED
ncbi:Uncharacterised protein [Mycobacteroides abscessus subsp. abscessus]|nr:Uncharacterised protein [Mycobacteroides abscessus subsp. abscessus]SLJ24788.1 Uncharacterised protein [Mycobacteroides abscessus subsp. abscessus]SLJ49041.1 Uncharacterised protein [Mycobacteroides abscessus subsp. abscessus]SLK57152.1 Uncharacterised protein [Mycobacteroides abscessus subsp. abscessus]